MGKNPPGEQDVLFVFLKALRVCSADETTNLISTAEMLNRERAKDTTTPTPQKNNPKKTPPKNPKKTPPKTKQMEESREGKRREEKEGENGRIVSACSLLLVKQHMEEWCLMLVKHSPVSQEHLFSISSL